MSKSLLDCTQLALVSLESILQLFQQLHNPCPYEGLCTIGAKIFPTSPEHNRESSYVSTLYVTRNIALYQ